MEKSLTNKNCVLNILKGVFSAVSCSLVLVLLLAIIYRFVDMSDGLIIVLNQIIKILSILFGCYVCFKIDKSKGMLKGAILGAIYTIVAFFVFSILSSSFSFNMSLIYDIFFASVIGLVGGIIFVNVRKK